MAKVQQSPRTGLYPTPVVLVSCVDEAGRPNIITIAWAGVACSTPPLVGIGVQPVRYSYGLIKGTGDFVVNIPREDQLWAVDYCGSVSGREVDKFDQAGLTPAPASRVKSPLIQECPVNLECLVRHSLMLGSHELFLGEVVAVHIDEEALGERGRWDMSRLRPLTFCYGDYWTLRESAGRYGFSRRQAPP